MMNRTNLWNLADGKTKETMAYIKRLSYAPRWECKRQSKFERIRDLALTKKTANEMLETIGFNLDGLDEIYADSSEE